MARKTMGLLVGHNVERSLRVHARKHLRGSLIDIGCGTKPYKDLLAPLVEQHVGLDHADCRHDPSEIVFYLLDKLDKAEGWTYGYTVVARKP